MGRRWYIDVHFSRRKEYTVYSLALQFDAIRDTMRSRGASLAYWARVLSIKRRSERRGANST